MTDDGIDELEALRRKRLDKAIRSLDYPSIKITTPGGAEAKRARRRAKAAGATNVEHEPSEFASLVAERKVNLIDEEGNHVGVVPHKDAQTMAKAKGLELFMVNADASPPVARMMDYGRYKFDLDKRERAVKQKHSSGEKELRVRCEIEEHDFVLKMHSALDHLSNGKLVRVIVEFGGQDTQRALRIAGRICEELGSAAVLHGPDVDGQSVIIEFKS